jgi:dipeptidyl aminopeptidase/acylaminoacyl peptidase
MMESMLRHRSAPALALAAVVACTAGPAAEAPTPTPSASAVMPPTGEVAPHPVSLPALMEQDFNGGALRIRSVRARSSAYTSYTVGYRSGDLMISGLLNIPAGDGPFPALVLAHGYIDPEVYSTGRGFEISQDYLARRGYVVLHTDYRNHASSDDDPRNDVRLRLGYTEDVINAVLALRRSGLPSVDPERIGILGRSMGGGVALNVAVVAPEIADAIVIFAPVSSDAVDNFNRWIRRPDRRALALRIIERYGSPREEPEFWRDLSARAFFDRVAVPIQIHHGTADERVPVGWSRETHGALRDAGKRAGLFLYPGERHAFGPAYGRAMARTVAFFERHLG